MNRAQIGRNFFGGFADCAVLLPLIALLSSQVGFDLSRLLITTGLAYIISSFYFKIPISVQPLKSIAVGAVALGASVLDVRLAGIALGVFCLLLLFVSHLTRHFTNHFTNHFLEKNRLHFEPSVSFIHQIQTGLGVLLILQGLRVSVHFGWQMQMAVLGGALILSVFNSFKGYYFLGMIAVLGVIAGLIAALPVLDPPIVRESVGPNYSIILALLLPQLILTLTNSVFATQSVCKKYFNTKKVSVSRLLTSIGLGNLLVSTVSGMPYCHGAGGVTAHFKGGSTHFLSTAFFGLILFLAGFAVFFFKSLQFNYPPLFTSTLLITTGVLHLMLVKESLRLPLSRIQIAVAVVIVALTSNLVWVFFSALMFEVFRFVSLKRGVQRNNGRK